MEMTDKKLELIFRYGPFDRRSRRITVIIAVIVAAGLGAIVWFDDGSYLTAWFLAIVTAVALLYVLSIPMKITVDETELQIHCTLELTTIPLRDIKTIRMVSNRRLRYTFPVLGSYGFFGYYGYYFNLRKWDTLKLYARRWGNFIQIETVYEDVYVVSSPEPEQLVAAVRQIKSGKFRIPGTDSGRS